MVGIKNKNKNKRNTNEGKVFEIHSSTSNDRSTLKTFMFFET